MVSVCVGSSVTVVAQGASCHVMCFKVMVFWGHFGELKLKLMPDSGSVTVCIC